MLVELLKPAGLELGRRWLSALLLVPPDQREQLVEEVERRITKNFGDRSPQASSPVVETKTKRSPSKRP